MGAITLAKRIIYKASSRHDKIFILPTRYGFYFIAIVFILFLISLSYGHSLAFSTTFIFVSLVMTSAHFTNFNLAGIKVIALYIPDNIQEGEASFFRVTLRNTANKSRFDIQVCIGKDNQSMPISLSGGETGQITFEVKNLKRGEYLLKRLTVSSTFPFGLFYAWKYWYEDNLFSVLPAYSENVPNLPNPTPNLGKRGGNKGAHEIGAEEFYGHQNYQEGMPLRAIDWKAYARGKGILLKRFIDEADVFYLFKINEQEKNLEERISQLAVLVDKAEAMGLTYAVVLGQEKPEYGKGRNFKIKTLKRLANHETSRKELI